jgi:tetratricopeptide (TPR) repeat protein
MPRRYFNWKLVIVLVIGLVVLGITAFGLRKWQRSRMAYGALDKGNKAYDKCLWEEAAKNLGRYLAVTQNDVPVLLKYADAQFNIRPLKRNNVQQAVAAYRAVLRIDKGNSEAGTRLVGMYLGMGMPGEAELIAIRVLQANPSPELQRMLAMALINQRKFEEAANELKSIIKEHPEQILAYGVLGQLTEQRPGDASQAPQLWFDEAVKNNSSSALAYIMRGSFYLRTNDKVKALSDLEHAEKLDLSDPAIRLYLAKEFINANVLDKAEKHLTLVQVNEPTNQLLWQTWAQLALKSQSKTKMLNIAETGLKELASQPWDFMPIAAELYIRCDELDLASDCISKLREKDIAPAATAFQEGLISDKKGQSYEAVKCWYRAIQSGAESAKVRLVLAVTLSRLGDKQSAIRQLRTLLSEQPNLFEAHITLAKLFAETGSWAEAGEQARIARQISPGSLDAALLYIQARIRLLAENQTDKDSPMWQDIKDQLTVLENAADGALEVKLLQLQLAMQQGNFSMAEALVTKLKESYPSQIKVAMAEVELLAAQDKSDDAILLLNNIVEKFPQDFEPVRYLAILLARQDKREKCEGIVETTLAHFEEPGAQRELCLLLADLYDRWGQEEKAYKLLTSLTEKLPNDVPIKQRLLRCKQVIKNLEKAQQLVNDIKSLEGESGWQWRYEQARIWAAQDNYKDRYPQIISLLKENLLANPDDQASRVLLAYSYEKAGELQLAISTSQEALSRTPADIHIIIPTVAALYRANEYDRADKILQQAAKEELFHPDLKRLELQSYLRRGELSSAGNILENLLAEDPNNSSIGLSLALLKMRQNRFAEADELLTKLKFQESNSLQVTVARIELNIRQNKTAEAILLCDEIINKFNDASAYILRARTYAMLGQADKAEEDFKYATSIEPNNAETWAAKSDFYRSTAQFDTAIADIRKAMSLEPNNLGICKHAVPLFLASDDRETAREGKNILDKALTSNPEDIELRLFKARSFLTEGTAPSIKLAISTLQKITEEQPKIAQAWTLLGEIALQQGQATQAMDIALQGLAHQPNDKSLLLLKARVEAVRSPALAIPTLKALQELDPNDADVAVNLANTYLAANQFQEAVNLLKAQSVSCSGTPDERKINIAFAVALHKNNNKLEAQEIFNSLYHSEQDDPAPLLAQAQLLKDDQLWDQLIRMVLNWYQNHPKDTRTPIAIAGSLAATENSEAKRISEDILRTILKNNSDCIEAMSALAMLLQTSGRSEESATLYQQVLAIQPDNVIAINNLAWILCEEHSKYQQALELVQRGLKIAPDYIDLIDTRGVVYYKLGQYDKAIQDFSRCLEIYPDGTPAATASYLHIGRALAGLKQKDEAIENLKKTLELNTKTGGLSAADYADAQRLLEELSRGG